MAAVTCAEAAAIWVEVLELLDLTVERLARAELALAEARVTVVCRSVAVTDATD